jgi:hypothetical protein
MTVAGSCGVRPRRIGFVVEVEFSLVGFCTLWIWGRWVSSFASLANKTIRSTPQHCATDVPGIRLSGN